MASRDPRQVTAENTREKEAEYAGGDTHLPPYRGTLPWDECRQGLHDAGYQGVFLLEVFEKFEDLPRLLTDEWKGKMRVILNNRA
jgi:sugar phosphate isomerase/epimerase